MKNSPALWPEPFGELAQQVLIGASEEIGLHVGETQAVAGIGEGLDYAAQLRRIDVALAIPLGSEVDDVDHAGERRVLFYDGPHRFREMLADILRLSAPFRQRPLEASRPLITPQRASGGI